MSSSDRVASTDMKGLKQQLPISGHHIARHIEHLGDQGKVFCKLCANQRDGGMMLAEA